MSSSILIGIEMGVVFLAVVGWGAWELYKLKQGK